LYGKILSNAEQVISCGAKVLLIGSGLQTESDPSFQLVRQSIRPIGWNGMSARSIRRKSAFPPQRGIHVVFIGNRFV